MSKSRILLVISILVASLIPLQSVTAAEIPDEQFSLFDTWEKEHPADKGDQTVGVWFNDFGFSAVAQSSSLIDESNPGQVICASIEACPTATKFYAKSILHFCSDATEINCIVTAYAKNSAGKRIEYTNRRFVPADQERVFPGDADYRLPQGSTASLGTFQGIKNLGGNENYTVAAYILQRFTIVDRQKKIVQSTDPLFLANITGVNLETGNYSPRKTLQKVTTSSIPQIDYENSDKNNECLILDNNLCGKPVALPLDTTFALVLRMNTQFYGWLHGRLSNATFTQISSTDKYSEFEISGQGSKIPSAFGKTTLSQMSEAEWAGVVGGGGKPSPENYGSKNWPPMLNIVASVRGTYMMNSFTLMQKYIDEKAISMPTYWSVRNVESGQVTNASGQKGLDCLYKSGGDKGKILGFVNTNATAYTSGPPTFNESEGALEYRVAAPHLAKDGSEFKGMYSLQIDSNVARCMFGTIGSSVKATVSVINKEGQNTVSTTTVNESNGMFKFLAAGFTFSSPTIRVKLENAPVVAMSPTPTAQKPTTVTKKITCVKGKTIKTVSGVNPKCPSGFKKK
jgi:hypothetical protein